VLDVEHAEPGVPRDDQLGDLLGAGLDAGVAVVEMPAVVDND
jgi:hypothetical protein